MRAELRQRESNRQAQWIQGQTSILLCLHRLFAVGLEVCKSGCCFEEPERNILSAAISVLRDVDLGNSLAICFGVVPIFSINKHDNIGILFDRSGLSQVGEKGTMIRSVFHGTRKSVV